MKNISMILLWLVAAMLSSTILTQRVEAASSAQEQQAEPEKGPHRGRMLRDGEFAIELAIFETGVPPEFRVWVTDNGKAVDPKSVALNVKLGRLGSKIDDINFRVQSDFLRGDMEIYEPHSFVVTVEARYENKSYRWEYDNFEGRTTIEDAVANAMGIVTEIAGPATLHQTFPVFGYLTLPPGAEHQIFARFDGEVVKRHVNLGDRVTKGQTLLTVESNSSLKPYRIKSPINGLVSEQRVNSGEQTGGRKLLTLTDTNQYLAKLAIYPSDYNKVAIGTSVSLNVDGIDETVTGEVSYIEPVVRDDHAKLVWVKLANKNAKLASGSFVKAEVEYSTVEVPLAVKRVGLQGFRDFTVVYAKVGEEYEVRMLDLGIEAGEWVEVLGGLEPGTEYVTENSYILKADVEKSGASHDH